MGTKEKFFNKYDKNWWDEAKHDGVYTKVLGQLKSEYAEELENNQFYDIFYDLLHRGLDDFVDNISCNLAAFYTVFIFSAAGIDFTGNDIIIVDSFSDEYYGALTDFSSWNKIKKATDEVVSSHGLFAFDRDSLINFFNSIHIDGSIYEPAAGICILLRLRNVGDYNLYTIIDK